MSLSSFITTGLLELAAELEQQGALLRRAAADLYCCSNSTEWVGYAAARYAGEAMGVHQRLLLAADQTDTAAALVRTHAWLPPAVVGS